MQLNLFDSIEKDHSQEEIAPGAFILYGFARLKSELLISGLNEVIQQAPFRHMVTPGGFIMSVAMTNCGSLGWSSDKKGYRYARMDPLTAHPWPKMPDAFSTLAHLAAEKAGYENFKPDSCLINRYEPGSKLSLHQDKNEKDLAKPIVSVSLGIPAIFLFGGLHRQDKTWPFQLDHGDVVVWGGSSRLRYHGIKPLKQAWHPQLGATRINLTFRKAI